MYQKKYQLHKRQVEYQEICTKSSDPYCDVYIKPKSRCTNQ